MLSEVYQQLKSFYIRLDPHAETWNLWIKANKSTSETYEVAIGTILVQNTNWKNVDKAIANLKSSNVSSFEHIQRIKLEKLEHLVRPAGFFTQKAQYLKSLSTLLLSCYNHNKSPSRQELIDCKGIGKETADSILVYCFQHPVPIVGTYTRRFLARFLGNVSYLKIKYENIQQELNKDLEKDFEVFGRFHALVVCHGQNLCQKNNPKCSKCFLLDFCIYGHQHKTDPEIAKIQTIITKSPKTKKTKT